MSDKATPARSLESSLIDSINYMIGHQPQLLSPLYDICNQRMGRKSFDVIFLYELYKDLMAKSRSQLRQDLFVLTELGFKRDGYFVEFGGANGVDLSNSYLLEKEFGWQGIVAEPAHRWHAQLHKSRTCHIEKDCVWRVSGDTLVFNETDIGELSTLDSFSDQDLHKETRKQGKTYPVTTISLADMLEKYGAPRQIDYLSIDTEGSEYDILSHFDFSKYDIRVITCEHNYTPMRQKIHTLLSKAGYVRKLEQISQFDDWYVKSDHPLSSATGWLF